MVGIVLVHVLVHVKHSVWVDAYLHALAIVMVIVWVAVSAIVWVRVKRGVLAMLSKYWIKDLGIFKTENEEERR